MRKLETYGHVDDSGKLFISYRARFDNQIKLFSGRRVKLSVEPVYRKRSSEQNAYYWGVIVNECAEGYFETTGETLTKEAAHELLKYKCNCREIVNEQTGEVLIIGQSTAQMTTVQMMEYWSRCREFIYTWFGRTVPEPNEQTELFK